MYGPGQTVWRFFPAFRKLRLWSTISRQIGETLKTQKSSGLLSPVESRLACLMWITNCQGNRDCWIDGPLTITVDGGATLAKNEEAKQYCEAASPLLPSGAVLPFPALHVWVLGGLYQKRRWMLVHRRSMQMGRVAAVEQVFGWKLQIV